MAQYDAVRDNRSASDYEIDRSTAVPRAEVLQGSIAGARDLDNTYWSEQNGVLVRNNVIPQVDIDHMRGHHHRYPSDYGYDRYGYDRYGYNDYRGGDYRYGNYGYGDPRYGDPRFSDPRYGGYRNGGYRYGSYDYGNGDYGYGYGYGDYRGGVYGAGRYGAPPFIPHRRPPEFDRPYGRYGGTYGDGYSDLRARTEAFRRRSYDEFVARRSEKLERIYEQRYERLRARGGRNAIDEIPDRRGIDPRNARNPETRSPYERTPAEIPSPPQQRERLYNNDLAPTPPGYDPAKWNDPEHLTTKYVVGRAIESDLIPVLRQADLPKNDLKQITEQYWRQNAHLVERDGSKILGYNGEKLLIQDPTGKIVQSDTVVSIGGSDEQMQAGWSIEEDHRKIDFNAFKR